MIKTLQRIKPIYFSSFFTRTYYPIKNKDENIKDILSPEFVVDEQESESLLSPNLMDPHVRIAVVGIGGCGGNIIERFLKNGANEGFGRKGVDFYAINTDVGALKKCCCTSKIQIGLNCTGGVGAGGVPSVGRKSAEENVESVIDLLGKYHCTFLCAGMGGGTGSGALPVVASALKDNGSLTIGVVTTPFQFEGTRRKMVAAQCMEDVEKSCDTLIVVPNENIFNYIDDDTVYNDAFQVADNVLLDGVKGVTDLITKPGLINLDFSDVKTVMKNGGRAFMGTGFGSYDDDEDVLTSPKKGGFFGFGSGVEDPLQLPQEPAFQRSNSAIRAALHNPLLEYSNITAAENVIVNITGSQDLTLHEVRHVSELIKEIVNPSTNLLIGTSLDPLLKDRIKVSIVITGLPKTPHLDMFEETDPQTKMLSLRSDTDMTEKKGFWAWIRRNF